jgi:hypothetical protein
MFDARTIEGLARHVEKMRTAQSEAMTVEEMSHFLDELEASS